MPGQDGQINVAILAVPEVTASALYGMLDLFSSPGRDFPFIITGEAGEQRMHPYIVARASDGFQAANGISVKPDYDFKSCPQPDIVCIPDFFVNPGESVAGKYDPEARWLKQSHENGAMLASACSGAVLLGEAQRIVMAGGGSSWQDLALYLIARFVGLKEAMEVAKVYMLQWHDMGQQPFASLTTFRQTTDAVVNRCQEWLAMNYKTHAPVAAMAALSGLPERSFIRRFTKATGMKPLDYVHALRLEEAKQMLETTDLPIEAIANEAGYEDASFFGRLFRRKTGLTPAHYRGDLGL
jgi:transcriptional regulator GlxA family with amidase domain